MMDVAEIRVGDNGVSVHFELADCGIESVDEPWLIRLDSAAFPSRHHRFECAPTTVRWRRVRPLFLAESSSQGVAVVLGSTRMALWAFTLATVLGRWDATPNATNAAPYIAENVFVRGIALPPWSRPPRVRVV